MEASTAVMSAQTYTGFQQRKQSVDINHVPHHQREMHSRLLNWAMWVKPGQSASICPMFKTTFKSNSFQWHAPEYRPTCDVIDAQYMEKQVCKLPKKERDALVWWYVYKTGALKARKFFGETLEGLNGLVVNGRQMLINREE